MIAPRQPALSVLESVAWTKLRQSLDFVVLRLILMLHRKSKKSAWTLIRATTGPPKEPRKNGQSFKRNTLVSTHSTRRTHSALAVDTWWISITFHMTTFSSWLIVVRNITFDTKEQWRIPHALLKAIANVWTSGDSWRIRFAFILGRLRNCTVCCESV